MYTYDMRRNKHNIQTYYRTRLFWLKNGNDKENKYILLQIYKKTKTKKEKNPDTIKGKRIVSQVDSLHGIG